MADDKKQPETKTPEAESPAEEASEKKSSSKKSGSKKSGDAKNDKWTTGAKVGAAVGSAAIAAALMYAGRHKVRKLDEFKAPKPKSGTRYENEPVDDADEEGKE